LTKIQDPSTDPATPACRECRQVLGPRHKEDVLDKFGGFVSLRCTASGCGHEDWYNNVVILESPDFTQPSSAGPGEVWIHDVVLGISLRVEAGVNYGEPIESRQISASDC
jgi:hypothetical protein